jgi:hypothetical protein
MPETAMVGKITTTSIGGTGQQFINGIKSSYVNLREFVNNNETTNPNALSGTILATSGYGTIIEPYDESDYYPDIQFIFTPIQLTIGVKYVVEWVIGTGPGLTIYVQIIGTYTGGQAYDIDGNNLELERDSPMGVWKICS